MGTVLALSDSISTTAITTRVQTAASHLDSLHQQITDLRERKRLAENARKQRPYPNLQIGCYVLVARRPPGLPEKAALQWTGPHKVVDLPSPHLVTTEHLVTNDTRIAHIQRVRLYCDASLNVTTSLRDQVQHDDFGTYLIDSFLAWREHRNQWEILVHWLGFDAADDSWEPLHALLVEVPQQLIQWLQSCLPDPTAELLLSLCENPPS